LFDMATSGEHWLVEPSLKVLRKLSPESKRLCDLALRVLRSYSTRDTAAAIVEEHADKADPSLIDGALPSLIHLAHPMRSRFGMGDRPQIPVTGPLRRLFKAHPDAVKAGLKNLLELADSYDVRTAACGVAALANIDKAEVRLLARELISKLARAQYLIQGREDDIDDAHRGDPGVGVRPARAARPRSMGGRQWVRPDREPGNRGVEGRAHGEEYKPNPARRQVSVTPGRAIRREPGIQTRFRKRLWISGSALRAAPE
jgi:hypothetical protein